MLAAASRNGETWLGSMARSVTMSRLTERMEDRLRATKSSQSMILAFVAGVVLVRLVFYALASVFLIVGDIELYRVTQAAGTAFSAVLEVILLLLVWMLFSTLQRVERESERVQSFMDNVYRNMLQK